MHPSSIKDILQSIMFNITPWQLGSWVMGAAVTAWFIKRLTKPARSSLRNLPGPDTYASYFAGNALEPASSFDSWLQEYGPTFQYKGLFLARELCTADPRALQYILARPYEFVKPQILHEYLVEVLGNGAVAAEGDSHRRQRKAMNPCFGPAQIRDLMPIFYERAFLLRELLYKEIHDNPQGQTVDMSAWFNRVTLDIVGLAGFDYHFDALTQDEDGSELGRAFKAMFAPSKTHPLIRLFRLLFPILKPIPVEARRTITKGQAVIEKIGNQLVRDKKSAVLAENIVVDKKAFAGRDLLSLLIRANMAEDVSEADRLTDQEVMGQISTLIIAGFETTSTSLSWLLFDLAKPENAHIQSRLRTELLTVDTDEPSMDTLNALPYLDAVVRETLRKDSIVDTTIRMANKDAIIPLSQPYVDRNGVARHEVYIAKGESITIPVISVNHSKSVWGDDAADFRPERWLDGKAIPSSNEIPGIVSGMMTFLSGPRHCIGYRMAIMEMKVIIFAILRGVQYDLPDPAIAVQRAIKAAAVARPFVRQEDGSLMVSMPLLLRSII